MGLEEKVVTPNSKFNCIGYSEVYGVRIHCWNREHPHGVQTLTEGLGNSCNPVFIEIATKVGKTKFQDYLKKFGLKEKTGINLPSEGLTLSQSVKTTGPVELATMGIGHGISMTPLHLITAISAIANGGTLMEPQIVKSYMDANGKIIEKFEPKVVNRVVSKETSHTMMLMLEKVVLEGSGKLAYIPGNRVAGKTGTSEKLVKGVYSKSLAYSSFIGIAPVENPQIVVLVVVDEPKFMSYGSKVAAPIAHDIMTDTLRYLKIEPNIPQNTKKVTVPNLVGKTYEQAITILEASSLVLNGDSSQAEDLTAVIKKQYPAAGTSVNSNSLVIISTTE
jgi:stage V sporulation protein D (sporulation-specific penicillin-binding protein)